MLGRAARLTAALGRRPLPPSLLRATAVMTTSASFSEPAVKVVTFTVVGPGNFSQTIRSPPGRPLLRMMQASGVDLIVAACNGKAQCSTCHVILPPVAYDALPRPSFAEEDLLDIAADATDYSRLACQCIIAPGLDGATITIPDRVVNRMDDDAGVPVPTLQLRAVSASAR